MLVTCAKCGIQCEKLEKHVRYAVKHNYKLYCSRACVYQSRETGDEVICVTCNKSVWRARSQQTRSKSGNLFCSRSCATVINNKTKVGEKHHAFKGADYRGRALKAYGARCVNSNCPSPVDLPVKLLDVDHIDGNRSNNDIANLQVLCVLCHAAKTREVVLECQTQGESPDLGSGH